MQHLVVNAAASLAFATALTGARALGGDVAIVVNPQNPESGVSFSRLQRIFRQETQHWKAGERIYLILQETGTAEKDVVLERLYRMSETQLKQFWLGKLYRGEMASFPRVVSSSAAVKRIVAQAPNAIGFVDASAVDATVKVWHIDGKRPGESGYLLAASSE